MKSFDLKDRNHNFKLSSHMQEFFNFKVGNMVYKCIGLPFDASFLPLYFIKLLRPLYSFFKNPTKYDSSFTLKKFYGLLINDFLILTYLDDFLFIHIL